MNKDRYFLGDSKEPQALITRIMPIKEGSDIYDVRITIFVANTSQVAKHYRVIVPVEVVEDSLRLESGANEENIKEFVYKELWKRYQESDNEIPQESGLEFHSNGQKETLN